MTDATIDVALFALTGSRRRDSLARARSLCMNKHKLNVVFGGWCRTEHRMGAPVPLCFCWTDY